MNENNLRKMRKAMYEVVNNRRGTAYGRGSSPKTCAWRVRPAPVKSATSLQRSAHAGSAETRTFHGSGAITHCLSSFAPYEAPRYRVSVLVEHGGGGSTAAAPIARDVMLQALYGGEPPLEAYPKGDRDRIAAQQEELRELQPQSLIDGNDQA